MRGSLSGTRAAGPDHPCVRRRGGLALDETIAEQLDQQRMLIVLDNCEHLVAACSDLVVVLTARCPQVHVLATSRVPLVVEGEASFEVAPLPVPAPGARSAAMIASAEEVRPFELRARQVSTDFRIAEENALAVAEICRRLDGIPLAIELAAARVRVLAPGQIAAALADRFVLLTGGPRGRRHVSAPSRRRWTGASTCSTVHTSWPWPGFRSSPGPSSSTPPRQWCPGGGSSGAPYSTWSPGW